MVQTLHEGSVDRESVVVLREVSPRGVEYDWSLVEVWNSRDTVRDNFRTFVSLQDMAHSIRLRDAFDKKDPLENPSYTRWTLSSDILSQLRAKGSPEYSILSWDSPSFGPIFGGHGIAVRWRGKLTGTGIGKFPLLINDQRVIVPAVHARGDFTARGQSWSPDIWILNDDADPLILKVSDQHRVFQTVRINSANEKTLEGKLETKCRAEVPGIYFEFNSAALDPASDNTIEGLAKMLSAHNDWSVTIEGHTDNIGSDPSNQTLSEKRAESVRSRLISRYHIAASRLRAAGYGAKRPVESNATIEGRARNRRVELLRPCGGSTQ